MTTHTLVLTLPRTLLLTTNQRVHHMVRAERTREIRQRANLAARPKRVHMDRAHLTVGIGWPDKRRRDAHNLIPTLKAAIDGIVAAGWLPDDDDAHLIGPDLRPHIAGHKGHVVLVFNFVEVAA